MARLALVTSEFDGPADEAPPLDVEDGSSLGWIERLMIGMRDGAVIEWGDYHARDMAEALGKDYKLRQLERVLVNPIESAKIGLDNPKGGSQEILDWVTNHLMADALDGGTETPLPYVVSQMTSAEVYKKAFFECVWTKTDDDKIGLKKAAYRPATTCRMRRTTQGVFDGFEQEGYFNGLVQDPGKWPIVIPPNRAFVHIYGQRRDPMNGVSDLDVAYWCYKTKQKILLLWFAFADRVSLPQTLVIANDLDTARNVAKQIAQARASGVVPIAAPGGGQGVDVKTLDLSGKGGEQFKGIIDWLDQAAANSILAGFTNLTNLEKNGGSFALSKDASDFYLQTREASAREKERDVRRWLIARLVKWNFGLKAPVPVVKFEPLNAEDKTDQITMLTDLMRSRDPALVPDEFIGELATQVADYLGMDGAKIRTAFDKAAADAKAKAAAMGVNPAGQAAARVAGAVGAATRAVNPPARGPVGRGASIPGVNSPPLPASY